MKAIFKDQIEDLESNFRKLYTENENYVENIKVLRKNYHIVKSELEKSKEANSLLENQLENARKSFSENLSEQDARLEFKDEKMQQIQIELTKTKSKLDETTLELSEFKTNYLNKMKLLELNEKKLEKKSTQCEDLKTAYENLVCEMASLNRDYLNQKEELEEQRLKLDLETNESSLERERVENFAGNLFKTLENKEKSVERLIEVFDEQNDEINRLKQALNDLRDKYLRIKPSIAEKKALNDEKNSTSMILKFILSKILGFMTLKATR
jgi:chromosome segregation ATPase